jgi:hypothetical protein
MKDLNRRFLLFTTLIAVLCTIICPSARGGSLGLFTTTFKASDDQGGKVTFGPVDGDTPWKVAFSGDAYVPAWGISVPYADEAITSSAFDEALLPTGEIKIGSLTEEGALEGYDALEVKGKVNFSMTIEPVPDAPPAPSGPIQILFIPTLSGECKNESWPPPYPAGSSLCYAEASASITDNTTGFSQSANLPLVSGKGHASIFPALAINASEGDTFAITLTTVIQMIGGSAACSAPGGEDYCGSLGSEAKAAVDPLFEFADPSLSEYYSFGFSPNITTTPEPSALILLGANLLIFVPLLRRRFGRN